MTRALFLHELRNRRQALALAVALALGGPWAVEALLGVLGPPTTPLCGAPSGWILALGITHPVFADLLALGLAALALHTATDAFPGQRERGTDAFLAGLPLKPRSVFTARALTCAAVVVLVPLLRHPLYLLVHLALGDWPPGFLTQVAAPLFVGELLRAVVFTGLALAFAQGRRLGWILAASLLLALRWVVTYEVLGPSFDLLRFAGPGRGPRVATAWPGLGAAATWFVLASGATLLAYSRFVTREDALVWINTALRRGPLLPPLARFVSMIVLAAVPLSVVGDAVRIGPTKASYPDAQVTAQTERFRFSYATRLSARARPIIATADRIHARVTALLGVAEDEMPLLDVALTDAGMSWVDGDEAPWIDLDHSPRLALARLTCESLLRRRLGDRLERRERAMRTFEEGLCRNVAWRATDADPFGSRFQAAVLHSRRPFRMDEVFDRRELRFRGDEAGRALGEAFVEALVREGGVEVIPALLTILTDLPARPLGGALLPTALWVGVLTKVGLGIEQIEERLLVVLEDEVLGDPRGQIALPRLQVFLQMQEKPIGWRVLAVPDMDLPQGWYVVCRVRRDPPAEPKSATRSSSSRLSWDSVSTGWSQPKDDLPPPQRLGPDPKGCHAFFLRSSPFRGSPWVQVGLSRVDPLPLLEILWEEWVSPEGRP